MSQTKAQLISDLVQALNFTGTATAPANGLFLSASNQLKLATASTERLKIDGTEVVVNDTGASVDFRVEGDTDANLLFVDASADNVGIGTISAGGKLAILSNASTYEGLELQTPSGDASGEFHIGVHQSGATSGRTIVISRGGSDGMTTESLRIDQHGQVGIGVTPDTWSTGQGITIGTSQATLWGTGDQINLSGNAYFNSGWKAAASKAGASQIEQALGNIDFKVSGSVTADSAISFDNAMRIKSDGNVGIGTTSPSTTLHLDSGGTPTTIQIDSDTESSIDFNDHGGSAKRYKVGTNISSNDGQLEIKDMTANVERVRLDSNGNVIAANSIVSANLPGRNLLINGAMDIWQRGTSTSSSGEYQADRFWMSNAATYSRDTSVPSDNFVYSAKLTYGSSDMAFGQPVELKAAGEASPFLPGGKCTLSFYAKTASGTEAAGVIINFRSSKFVSTNQVAFTAASGNASDLNFTATTSWQRFTFTFTVPTPHSSSVLAGLEIFGISSTIFITGVQLELGEIATTFEFRDIGTELALCQRYAHVVDARGSIDNFAPIGNGRFYNGTDAQILINLPATMRQPPTFDGNHTTSSNTFFLNNDGGFGGAACTQLSLNERSFNTVTMTVQSIGNISGQTIGLGTTLYCDGSDDARLMLVAEF